MLDKSLGSSQNNASDQIPSGEYELADSELILNHSSSCEGAIM